MSTTPTDGFTPNSTFSPLTCYELLDKLSEKQVLRELKLVMNSAQLKKRDNPNKQLLSLKKHFSSQVLTDNDKITEKFVSLTDSFSRAAGKQIEQLQQSIAAAQQLVTTLQQTPTSPPPSTPSQPSTSQPAAQNTAPPSPVSDKPYVKLADAPLDRFDQKLLDDETDYDRTFQNRKVAYFGDVPYRYAGGNHPAKTLPSGSYLAQICVGVEDVCKENAINFKQFNSVTVTMYETHASNIPPHSDDEPSIVPGSDILTVSLGATRRVVFRRRPPGDYREESLEVEHGEIYIMTRSSQDYYDHAVPKMRPEEFTGPRISITFRALATSNTSPAPPSNHSIPSPPARKRRVLILSDSKNATFDCSLFRDSVVAFRENLFYLRDIEQHSQAIEQAELVLISAGINDIKNNNVSARALHDHMERVISRFGRTQFLFDSVTPVAMHADRFNKLNDAINSFNELMLNFSLRRDNFKLFDNPSFGLPHLARDGLHLNQNGKSVLTNCWVQSVLVRLGLRRGSLPLRHTFLTMARDFSSRSFAT